MLLCENGLNTVVMRISENQTKKFGDLQRFCISKWSNFSIDTISMYYSLTGHPKCMLDSEPDFENMVSLMDMNHINSLEVIVNEQIVDGDIDNDESLMNIEDKLCLDWNLRFESEVDLLPKFSLHQEKVLMSASWAHGITHVGQKFEGGATDFRNTLCKYAIECGFEFRYLKKEKGRVTAECSLKIEKGCLWSVHATLEKSNEFFYVKKLNNVHTCGVGIRTLKNRRMSSDLIASQILDKVRERPLTRPVDVVKDFQTNYGIVISYRLAWIGVEKARGDLYGDYALSFDQLLWYVDAVNRTNPRSCVSLEYDQESHHFQRFFIAFHGSIHGFNYCRPLIFVDGTFLKGRYRGNLFVATAKDGNQGLFPLAFAVVNAENVENWRWFLEHLSTIVSPGRRITFLSDRNAGILEGVSTVFPTTFHGYCLHHLKCNLKDKLSGTSNSFRDKMVYKFRKCAYAPTKQIFHQLLNEFLNEGGAKVRQFVENLPFHHWCNSHFEGERYGEMCSNVAESFNSWIREARHLTVTKLIDTIRVQLMDQMATRRDNAKK